MTTPDLSFIIPSKWKAIAALIGSGLSFVVPYVLQVTNSLPAPWPAVVGVVLFILSALGVYHAPYLPASTTVLSNGGVKEMPIQAEGAVKNVPAQNVQGGPYINRWRD